MSLRVSQSRRMKICFESTLGIGFDPARQQARDLANARQLRDIAGGMTCNAFAGFPRESIVKPLVSILIPAYNSEKWIADSIRSAVAQNLGTQRNHRC